MAEDIGAMAFFAIAAAFIALIVATLSRRARQNRRFAFAIQATIILGAGALFMLGAGLQSPAGYPHAAIPAVFLLASLGTHLIWCRAYPNARDN